MSNLIPIILPAEGDNSLKAVCLPFFKTLRSVSAAITDDLPDFLSECAHEIGEAWEESKPKEVDHA